MIKMPLFSDRIDAGQKLGQALAEKSYPHPLVLGLPRGGVVLAREVAEKLEASLEVVIARKIGAPGHEEYGIGAISEDGDPLFNPEVLSAFDPRQEEIRRIVERETLELRRRIDLYRGGPLPKLTGQTAILVDDGLATGVTAAAAGRFIRGLGPDQVILAVPVCPRTIGHFVRDNFDEIVCLNPLSDLRGVGLWYRDFTQVEDSEVLRILGRESPGAGKFY